jgi:hypothetical protein
VHHDRDAALAGREVGRHGDVAAEADDDIGLDPVDDLERRTLRSAEPLRGLQQGLARLARQRDARHELEREACLGDQPRLEAGLRAEAGDLDRRVMPEQGRGGREQGRGVTGRATTGEQDAHH